MQKSNLYHIQDSDRPMWVVALDWPDALNKWKELVSFENEQTPDEIEPCQGIQFVCDSNDLLL